VTPSGCPASTLVGGVFTTDRTRKVRVEVQRFTEGDIQYHSYWSKAVRGLESLGFYVGTIPGFLVCFVPDCVVA
jgi:hypothetical protein